MPFELSQLVIVSTAEGREAEGENTWNFEIVQNNDVYIHIGKNKDYRETKVIKNIIIDNFEINEKPIKGKIEIYRPSESEEKIYEYEDKYKINDRLIYKGEENNNLKELSIANQGGIIAFRYSNEKLRKI